MPLILLGVPATGTADASARLRDVLASADVLVCADSGRLAGFDVTVPVRVAGPADPAVADALRRDATVAAVVGDAGVSALVTAALAGGVAVSAVPGPDPAVAALAVSGLPTERFCVDTPDRVADLAAEPRTIVFADVADVAGMLAALVAAFGGDRPAALVTAAGPVRRDSLAGLTAGASGAGTLVVGGAPAPAPAEIPADGDLAAEVARLESGGTPRKQAMTQVARTHGVQRRTVYAAVVAARRP